MGDQITCVLNKCAGDAPKVKIYELRTFAITNSILVEAPVFLYTRDVNNLQKPIPGNTPAHHQGQVCSYDSNLPRKPSVL